MKPVTSALKLEPPPPPYNFQEQLAASHKANDLPFWEEAYRQAFPDFHCRVCHPKDGWHQREGVDATIMLDNSRHIKVDEKVRWKNRNGRIYDDIALEFWSNRERQVPGWVCKPLQCDYISYAIAPLGLCYLLPVIQLQLAWTKNCEKWKGEYFHIETPNIGYTTESIGVPVPILFAAMGQCLRMKFTPMEKPPC